MSRRDHLDPEFHGPEDDAAIAREVAERLRAETDSQPEQRQRPDSHGQARRLGAARSQDASAYCSGDDTECHHNKRY